MNVRSRTLLRWSPRILAIAVPLLIVGLLFFWSWRRRRANSSASGALSA